MLKSFEKYKQVLKSISLYDIDKMLGYLNSYNTGRVIQITKQEYTNDIYHIFISGIWLCNEKDECISFISPSFSDYLNSFSKDPEIKKQFIATRFISIQDTTDSVPLINYVPTPCIDSFKKNIHNKEYLKRIKEDEEVFNQLMNNCILSDILDNELDDDEKINII